MLKKERSFTSCHSLNIICLPCSTSLSLSFSLTKISSLFVMQISGETGCQRNYTVSMFHSGRLTYAHHSPTNFETVAPSEFNLGNMLCSGKFVLLHVLTAPPPLPETSSSALETFPLAATSAFRDITPEYL